MMDNIFSCIMWFLFWTTWLILLGDHWSDAIEYVIILIIGFAYMYYRAKDKVHVRPRIRRKEEK